MTNNQPPTIIFANEEQKRLWLGALRGEIPNPKTGRPFEQGKSYLETEDGKNCCLGVLQVMLSGDVSRRLCGLSEALPERKWLDGHGIEFLGVNGQVLTSPFLPELDAYASQVNDDGSTFLEIADAIEACSVVRSSE